ncbi:MAG: hypothetical protein BWZ05_02321 [Bacteroidetes bacterium ADurb.BinA245]|nr:MAG: hypothetical protein BWZ05_02321 [Bacteroidetes bacterium ADurb.BinA245]
MPIPLALSLAFTDARKASDVNTSVSKKPVSSSAMPVALKLNNSTGIPTPIKKALASENATPAYSLSIIFWRLMGCANISSINS